MPLLCCFAQISQLVPIRGLNMQNLLLWPLQAFQRKNKRTDMKHFLILWKWQSHAPHCSFPSACPKDKTSTFKSNWRKHFVSWSRKSSHWSQQESFHQFQEKLKQITTKLRTLPYVWFCYCFLVFFNLELKLALSRKRRAKFSSCATCTSNTAKCLACHAFLQLSQTLGSMKFPA